MNQSRNKVTSGEKYHNNKNGVKVHTSLHGIKNSPNSAIIFNDGTRIDWMLAKKKLRRKFKAAECWDIIENGKSDSLDTEQVKLPQTYKEYYQVELFKCRVQLEEAKKKSASNGNESQSYIRRSNRINNNDNNTSSNENNINIMADEDLADMDEYTLLKLQCQISANEKFLAMQESLEKIKSKKSRKIAAAIKIFDTYLGGSALSVIRFKCTEYKISLGNPEQRVHKRNNNIQCLDTKIFTKL